MVFHWLSTGRSAYAPRVIEPEQLDIFIPLHRRDQFRQWAHLAVEHNLDVGGPGGAPAFADWLRDNALAPAGLSHEALKVLVAAMGEYAVNGETRPGTFR
jgi:hypothetical protein